MKLPYIHDSPIGFTLYLPAEFSKLGSRWTGSQLGHDLLAALVEHEIFAGCRCNQFFQAILRGLQVSRCFHPDETAVAFSSQNVQLRCRHPSASSTATGGCTSATIPCLPL